MDLFKINLSTWSPHGIEQRDKDIGNAGIIKGPNKSAGWSGGVPLAILIREKYKLQI